MGDDVRDSPTAVAVPPADVDTGRSEKVRPRLRFLDRVRATSAGRITLKVVVAVAGVTTVLLGLVMIPLPGPGWLVVFAGLAILSAEYVWAKHLLQYGRRKIRGWTEWVSRRSWVVRVAIGAGGLLLIGVVVWLSVRNSFGIDLVEHAWRFLTSH